MMIEKSLHHIWIGPNAAPYRWLDTWTDKHPTWNYQLWDNHMVFNRTWRNQRLVDHYAKLGKWHGVADVIRYEILFEQGGFMPGADSECLLPIDELFENDHELFAVRCGGEEQDWARVDGKKDDVLPLFLRRDDKRLIAPIYSCKAGNAFAGKLIEELSTVTKLDEPWKTTGNVFCAAMIKKYEPKIEIWPMHYFIPYHPRTIEAATPYEYIGADKIYARHFWGTTNKCYAKGR